MRLQRWRHWAAAGVCGLLAVQAQAWSGHTLGTWQALSVMPELAERQVRAESLDSFLRAESLHLEHLLAEHEAWARTQVPNYPPRPDDLAYSAQTRPAERVGAFLRALRLNGDSRLKLFVQMRPGSLRPDQPRMPWVDITALKSGSAARENTYVQVNEGEPLAVLDVVATAAAEPDYGLDIGLFEDSGTAQGQRYGFGKQAFGSGSVDYSSQAPFHMGFFHEARIVNAAAGFLRRTHPESRIALFSALAKHAFASGHEYWGWRFTGWAMHYVQDLTQPYHTRALPGQSTSRMLWINALDLAGFAAPKEAAINLVANRHIVLENYQFKRMAKAYEQGHLDDALLVALRDTTQDRSHWRHNLADTRELISAEAAADADALDALLAKSFPARYVADPDRPLGNDADLLDMSRIAAEAPPADQLAFEKKIQQLLQRFGRHSRALVRALWNP